jgi:hypothetical protein
MRVGGPHIFVITYALTAMACEPPPPLLIEASSEEIVADGVSRVTLTVRASVPVEGAVVLLTSSRGALAASAVAMIDQEAQVELWAPLERELGREATRPVEVVARVVVSPQETWEARTAVVATAPTEGPPILFVDADPPAVAIGDNEDPTIAIVARRIADGDSLTVETTAGSLTDAAPVVTNGIATTRLRAGASAADAIVTVTHPGSGVSGAVAVRFAEAGEPLFDLTGTFVQLGPARVRLESAALTPDPQCVLAPSTVLVELVQQGRELEAHYTTCAVTFPSVTSVVGTVENFADASFYDAIPVVDASFELSGTALGARYAPPPSVVVVGAELDAPATDALPEDENDARVVDADDDGEPGVTVTNSLGGEQRIVYRNIGETQGRVRSSVSVVGDELGDLLAKTETRVFGIGGGFVPRTTALGSVVELQRVDGAFASFDADANGDGVISCQEAVDAAPVVARLDAPDTPFDCAGTEDE